MSFDKIDALFRTPSTSAFDRIDRRHGRLPEKREVDPTELCAGDDCPRSGCTGTFVEWHGGEMFGCCSCHLSPPCSWCVDATIICNVCDYEPWGKS